MAILRALGVPARFIRGSHSLASLHSRALSKGPRLQEVGYMTLGKRLLMSLSTVAVAGGLAALVGGAASVTAATPTAAAASSGTSTTVGADLQSGLNVQSGPNVQSGLDVQQGGPDVTTPGGGHAETDSAGA